MSSEPAAQSGIRNVKSPFSKIIATSYYDGAIEGFLEHRGWPEACVFRLLDWNRDTDVRVYEVARLVGTTFDQIVAQLFRDKLPTWPLWVLPSASQLAAEQLVDECFARSRPIATLTTADLFDRIISWMPAGEAPDSAEGLSPVSQRAIADTA